MVLHDRLLCVGFALTALTGGLLRLAGVPLARIQAEIFPFLFFLLLVVVLKRRRHSLVRNDLVRVKTQETGTAPAWQVMSGRSSGPAIPLTVVLGGGIIGMIGVLNVRGILPSASTRTPVVMAPLRNDNDGISSRAFARAYELVRLTYELPPLALTHSQIEGAAAGERYFREDRSARLIVSGTPEWLELIPAPGLYAQIFAIDGSAADEVHRSGIPVRREKGEPGLRLAALPERFLVPADPMDLATHFVGWLAGAITRPSARQAALLDEITAPEERLAEDVARRIGQLHEAGLIEGHWRSSTPVMVAHTLRAALLVTEGIGLGAGGDRKSPAALYEAAMTLKKVRRWVRKKYEPELYATVLNDSAVLVFLTDNDQGDRAEAVRWLWDAAATESSPGHPVRAAAIALGNLAAVEQSGLMD